MTVVQKAKDTLLTRSRNFLTTHAAAPIALCFHGHFYQPPRENPWTDRVPREPSAAPFHDWNARIHAECYRANAFARINDSAGRIEAIVDNYDRISFNFGPTLARWLGRHDPSVAARLRDGRRRAAARGSGSGGAIAQAYAHPIVPLLHAARRAHPARLGPARLPPPLRARAPRGCGCPRRRCRPPRWRR